MRSLLSKTSDVSIAVALRTGAGLLLGAGLATATSAQAAIFKNGFVDHSICCGTGGPMSFDGTPLRATISDGPSGGAAGVSTATATTSPDAVTKTKPVSATAVATTAATVPMSAPKEVEGHLLLSFAQLAEFKLETPAYNPDVKPEVALAAVNQQIPDAIKQFDGRRAQITGFMLPVKMEGQLVSQFLLMRDQMMCCYGVVPRMNDWVVVYAAKPVRFTPDVPVAFRGKLQVKAMQEQGFITGVFLLEEAAPGKL